ncbi:hypothetical protein HDU93_009750 [Gonapodya sp. JEL0774]|nr:hypothetical protein HDU93_009750 [Gonapodya sp. JEL0774]
MAAAQPPLGTVISAAPVLRDLRAELTTMVPAALRRKQISNKPKPALESERGAELQQAEVSKPARIPAGTNIGPKIPKGFRKMVNSAPDVDLDEGDRESGNGVVAFGLGALANKPPVSTVKKSQQAQATDEYANFMKSLEGEGLV